MIDLQIDAARQQESARLGGFGGEGSDIDDGLGGEDSEAGGIGGEHISAVNFFSIAGVRNYEVNLWGRLDRLEKSARAVLFSSIFARDAVALIVVTDVVTTYFRLLGAERQLDIALRTLRSRERGFALERARYETGAVDQLSFRQA